jgi:hypothetical protein
MTIRHRFSALDPIDNSLRQELLRELARKAEAPDGNRTKVMELIARNLLEKALAGDLRAIREIFDRVDGKRRNGTRVDQPKRVVFKLEENAPDNPTDR